MPANHPPILWAIPMFVLALVCSLGNFLFKKVMQRGLDISDSLLAAGTLTAGVLTTDVIICRPLWPLLLETQTYFS